MQSDEALDLFLPERFVSGTVVPAGLEALLRSAQPRVHCRSRYELRNFGSAMGQNSSHEDRTT